MPETNFVIDAFRPRLPQNDLATLAETVRSLLDRVATLERKLQFKDRYTLGYSQDPWIDGNTHIATIDETGNLVERRLNQILL